MYSRYSLLCYIGLLYVSHIYRHIFAGALLAKQRGRRLRHLPLPEAILEAVIIVITILNSDVNNTTNTNNNSNITDKLLPLGF